jgi:hypothetical protein
MPQMHKSILKWSGALLLQGGLTLLIAGLLFFVFEGIASFIFVFKQAIEPQSFLAERLHTRYDSQLGWVSIPNVYVRDMYGPGIYLRTNSRGFRNNSDFAEAVPSGKIRVVCSGDSFTLGYGVSNDHTWCQELAAIDPRLETVNMGQGGYGLDQAYLWYARDGIALDHDVQIFAFIGTDLRRMSSKIFSGYPKPTLAIQGDRLVSQNVPVPRVSAWDRLEQRLINFQELQSVKLLQRIFFPGASQSSGGNNPATLKIAGKVFEELAALNRKKSSTLVIAFLPTEGEYRLGMLKHIAALKAGVLQNGIAWVDLVEDFRKLPPQEAARLFIPEGQLSQYRGGAGHYTNEGNAFVARLLYERITALPAVAARLESPGKGRTQLSLAH